MKERPILFKGPMVQAILDGRKTQTRRAIKPQPDDVHDMEPYWHVGGYRAWRYRGPSDTLRMGTHNELQCPYGKPGDRLWVRETWANVQGFGFDADLFPNGAAYKCDCKDNESLIIAADYGVKWKASIHMPRWASRIALEITDIKVEWLQDITEEDARAEGARWKDFGTNQYGNDLPGWSMEDPFPMGHTQCLPSARMAFANYINKIHGGENWNLKPSCLWDDNPWVWIIEFKRLEASC